MAKSDKRQKQMANKRASKDVRFRSALAAGDQGGKSPYQQKIQRKLGNGRVDHRWMWWNEAVGRPQGMSREEYAQLQAELTHNKSISLPTAEM
jgi:hypothetical protein